MLSSINEKNQPHHTHTLAASNVDFWHFYLESAVFVLFFPLISSSLIPERTTLDDYPSTCEKLHRDQTIDCILSGLHLCFASLYHL